VGGEEERDVARLPFRRLERILTVLRIPVPRPGTTETRGDPAAGKEAASFNRPAKQRIDRSGVRERRDCKILAKNLLKSICRYNKASAGVPLACPGAEPWAAACEHRALAPRAGSLRAPSGQALHSEHRTQSRATRSGYLRAPRTRR